MYLCPRDKSKGALYTAFTGKDQILIYPTSSYVNLIAANYKDRMPLGKVKTAFKLN